MANKRGRKRGQFHQINDLAVEASSVGCQRRFARDDCFGRGTRHRPRRVFVPTRCVMKLVSFPEFESSAVS